MQSNWSIEDINGGVKKMLASHFECTNNIFMGDKFWLFSIFRSARPLYETEFRADHPFLFLIYDKQTNTILFFGVYQYPPTP